MNEDIHDHHHYSMHRLVVYHRRSSLVIITTFILNPNTLPHAAAFSAIPTVLISTAIPRKTKTGTIRVSVSVNVSATTSKSASDNKDDNKKDININMVKTYTRPGVEAAVRLSKLKLPKTTSTDCDDTDAKDNKSNASILVWENIENQYQDMLYEKNGIGLQNLDDACEKLVSIWSKRGATSIDDDVDGNNNDEGEGEGEGKSDGDGDGNLDSDSLARAYCTYEELETVLKWKFSKGKSRPLWKHLRSNSDKSVRDASAKAFSILSPSSVPVQETTDTSASASASSKDIDSKLKKAIEQFAILKGIGPASATAFLSLFRPDLCIFMDDEVIECLYPGKRAYSIKIYLEINAKCRSLAKGLGEGWTVRRVGKALWTAAKVSICENRSDLTLALDADETENEDDNDSDDAFKVRVAGKPNNGVGTNNRSKDEISIADSARRRSKRRKR